jgi:hypothetical protein
VKCHDLLIGQYLCERPNIDRVTQEPEGCERKYAIIDGEETYEDTAPIHCHAASRIICEDGIYNESLNAYEFERRTACRWTNGKYYRTTLFLSLFLGTIFSYSIIHMPLTRLSSGIFGIDRIYLGYYVSGLLKLFTCGFMLVGALVDFL